MNTGTALYQFTGDLTAIANKPLANAIRHLDVYEEYKGDAGKWVRFSGMRSGKPTQISETEIRTDNAIHLVYFVVRPVKQDAENRVAARELAQSMADQWTLAAMNGERLGDRVCDIGDFIQRDDWLQPGTLKMPTVIIQVTVNPRGS